VDDPQHASTEDQANELRLLNRVLSGDEVAQMMSTPGDSDALASRPNVIAAFDCMHYLFCLCDSSIQVLFAAENLLPAWHPFALHPQLYTTLYSQKFESPTPIQSQAIPKALSGRDVIGVAETVCYCDFVP
jgi:hypothetical protein